MKYNSEDEYITPLNLYRQYRGFSTIQSLADAAGLSRQTMSLACSGERTMKPENLKKVADLLFVDPSDLELDLSLENPCQKVFDIPGAMENIRRAISTCRARELQKKSGQIVSYLQTDSKELEAAMKFLLFCASDTAISILAYVLGISGEDGPDSCQTSPEGSPDGITALDQYRKQRGFTMIQLGQLSGIPRQTVSKLCKGLQKPNWNQLISLAQALHVDATDLDEEPDSCSRPGNVVNICGETARIEDAVARCRPRLLRAKTDCVLAYLKNTNPELQKILACLFNPSSPQQYQDILEETSILCGIAQFYRNYTPRLQIGYTLSPEEDMVSAFVLFEPWVYDIFRLQSPLSGINAELNDSCGRLIRQTIASIGTDTCLTTGDKEFPIETDASLTTEDRVFPIQTDACLTTEDREFPIQTDASLTTEDRVFPIQTDACLTTGNREFPIETDSSLTTGDRKFPIETDASLTTEDRVFPIQTDSSLTTGDRVFPIETDSSLITGDRKFPIETDSSLTLEGMDFPIEIDTCLTPEDGDFETLLIEQAEDYCFYQEADNIPIPELQDIFCSYVSENLWTAEIVAYELRDLDLERPFRLEKRQQQYQSLIGHFMSQYHGSEFLEKISSVFSHMKEEPEYEQELFQKLGLGEPV